MIEYVNALSFEVKHHFLRDVEALHHGEINDVHAETTDPIKP